MTRTMAVRATSYAAVLMLVLAAACGDSSPITSPPIKQVASVLVSPQEPSIIVGSPITLQAQAKAVDGEVLEREVSWSSENEAVATVSASGVVTTLAVGTVGIRATSEGRMGRTVLTVLPVPPVPVAEVRISVDNVIELEWNGSTQISAAALDAEGNVLPGRPVTWIINKPEVATITQDGAIQAVSSGTAIIGAMIEDKIAHVGLKVKTAPVVEILFDVATTGMEVGEMVWIATQLKTANGQILLGPVSWASSDAAIAKVYGTEISYGAVEAISPGDVTITASLDGISKSATFRVSPRPTYDLIYSRPSGQQSEIFTLSLEQPSTPVRLNAGNVSRDPSPSPDGTQFVFAVSQIDQMNKQQNDLYIVNRNGLNMRWLTRVEGIEDQPQWSPDGTKILFRGTDAELNNPNLFTINIDGTGLTNITAGLPADVTDKREPAWSHDGSKIAFIAARGGQHKIWTMNADGSNATQFTTDAGFDMTPTWSPDGSRIAFVRYNSGEPVFGNDIMIISSAGGTPTRLELNGSQNVPAWSPDGHYIAFSGTEGSVNVPHNVFTIRPDGSGLRKRTTDGGIAPAWIKR